jgi:hypothetical protein
VNYQEWREYRDRLLETRGPMRLDCMNPFRALSHMQSSLRQEGGGTPDPDEVAHAWSACTGVELPAGQWLATRGVRSTLEAWCRTDQSKQGALWLPRDVFPTYWATARATGNTVRGFSTLPALDLCALDAAGPHDCAVLPIPLSPAGRELTEPEIEQLRSWLVQSAGRTLMLDMVYAYRGQAHSGLAQLRATGQCIEAWSISKTWVQRQLFGVAVVPEGPRSALGKHLAAHDPVQLTRAMACFGVQPELPRLQQERFEVQWANLSDEIRAVHADWHAPACGYFAVLSISATDLLEKHDMLAVPASVFGAPDDEMSVITCLHAILRDEQTRDALPCG